MLALTADSLARVHSPAQPQAQSAFVAESDGVGSLVEKLREEASKLEPAADLDPAAFARARAKQSVRTLAIDLLQRLPEHINSSEALERRLVGLTIAIRRTELDGSIDRDPSLDEADWTLLASRLASVARAGASETRRSMRDAVAPIVRATSSAASGTRAPSMQDSMKLWEASDGFPKELLPRLATVDGMLVEADASPAHRASAQTTRNQLAAAGDLLAAPPQWLASPARQRLASELGSACDTIANGEGVRAGGLVRKLEVTARLIFAAAKLPASPAFDELHHALSESVGTGTLASLDDATTQLLLEAVGRLGDRPEAEREERIIRPLRSTLRGVSQRARAAEQELIRDAIECLRGGGDAIVRSPGWDRYARSRSMMTLVRRTSDVMQVDGRTGPSGPEPASRWTRLCSRILRLGQDLSRPDDRSPLAGEELRLLLGLVESLYPAADSPVLNGDSPIGIALLGDQRGLLASTLRDTRQTWLSLVDKEKDDQAKGAASVLAGGAELVRLVESLDPLASLWSSQASDRQRLLAELNSHPGLEVPELLFTELAEELPSRLQDVAKLLMHARAEEAQAARVMLRESHRDAAPLLLIASWRTGSPRNVAIASAWSELAGIEAWDLGPARPLAAQLSIDSFEWLSAQRSGHAAAAESHRTKLQNLALSQLEDLGLK